MYSAIGGVALLFFFSGFLGFRRLDFFVLFVYLCCFRGRREHGSHAPGTQHTFGMRRGSSSVCVSLFGSMHVHCGVQADFVVVGWSGLSIALYCFFCCDDFVLWNRWQSHARGRNAWVDRVMCLVHCFPCSRV